MVRYGGQERNVEGQIVEDFAKRMKIAVVNAYFKKKSGTQVDTKEWWKVYYLLSMRCNLGEIKDCKSFAGDTGDCNRSS